MKLRYFPEIWNFTDYVSDYQLLKNDSVPWVCCENITKCLKCASVTGYILVRYGQLKPLYGLLWVRSIYIRNCKRKILRVSRQSPYLYSKVETNLYLLCLFPVFRRWYVLALEFRYAKCSNIVLVTSHTDWDFSWFSSVFRDQVKQSNFQKELPSRPEPLTTCCACSSTYFNRYTRPVNSAVKKARQIC
jgi:hypothetical protein